jgi:uracil-DNA glycosylase
MPEFCFGYVNEPFKTLVATYPGEAVYPRTDFRTEWGPVFHRGRLDGSARVLVIGPDPGPHESILRRIFGGEAGRRVQGFLSKLGITRSYAMVNALLYGLHGGAGAKYVTRPEVVSYRNRWIDGLLLSGSVRAVVAFGALARRAWEAYTSARGAPAGVAFTPLTHPTFPEASGGTQAERDASTRKMLEQWNAALPGLDAALGHKDVGPSTLELYGPAFIETDMADIPSADLPAGTPAWMYDDDGGGGGWATCGYPSQLAPPATEQDAERLRREIIVIQAPRSAVS